MRPQDVAKITSAAHRMAVGATGHTKMGREAAVPDRLWRTGSGGGSAHEQAAGWAQAMFQIAIHSLFRIELPR